MKKECIEAVVKAAGRPLLAPELKDIENRINEQLRRMARHDRDAYLAMPKAEQYRRAAELAAQGILEEAAQRKLSLEKTIEAADRIGNIMADQKKQFGRSTLQTLDRMVDVLFNGDSNIMSVETRKRAIERDSVRQILSVYEAAGPRMLGLFTDKAGVTAFMRELLGGAHGPNDDPKKIAIAKQAAAEWNKVAESMRAAFNAGGGKVGKLRNWGLPQDHSQPRVARAGRERWVSDTMQSVDRSRYVKLDGQLMNDKEMRDFLSRAFDSISTGGAAERVELQAAQDKVSEGKANNIDPKELAKLRLKVAEISASIASRNAEHRSLFFRDGDAYMKYHAAYGGKDPYSVIMGHIGKLSRDIALVDVFGPNAEHSFNYWLERGADEDKVANRERINEIDVDAARIKRIFKHVAGLGEDSIGNRYLSTGFNIYRSLKVASSLGSAVISSLADNVTTAIGLHANRMPALRFMQDRLETMNPFDQAELRRARLQGLSLDTLIGAVDRAGQDSLGYRFTSKISSSVIRASMLNAITEGRRRAFGVTMMGSIGHLTREGESLAALHSDDRRILTRHGVTETDFAVWKRAELEDWGGGRDSMLTPESIYSIPDARLADLGDPAQIRREAALKLLGSVDEETGIAIIEPGAREVASTTGKYEKGTWQGEIGRSFFLFKGFPFALLSKQWRRGMSQETAGGKIGYLSTLVVGSTIMGALAQQIYGFVTGKDPQNMSPFQNPKFWIQALMKGGALGPYGDFLFSDSTQGGGNDILGMLAGPLGSDLQKIVGMTKNPIQQYAAGKNVKAADVAWQFAKGFIPGQNLWYARAALDHWIFNDMAELVSPGYKRRVEQRAKQQFKQDFYWRPGSKLPDRAPNLKRAIGQ